MAGRDMAYNERQKEYLLNYLKALKEIRFRVKPEEYKRFEQAARDGGYPSMRQFYLDSINRRMKEIEAEKQGHA